jgi:2-polyprenyl-6-methoxyphenol hydroxylase-like FAD-dependent oxidoreductase
VVEQYDLIVVGGGIAGAALAGHVAASGAEVLVLESERTFKDRVRGEWVAPWGVLELERLGILDLLKDRANAHDLPKHHTGIVRLFTEADDMRERYRPGRPAVTFFHPDAQEALIGWAAEQGAEVIRGARVNKIEQGDPASVAWTGEQAGGASAPLVVAADGRSSLGRRTLGREEQRRGEARLWAGVLMENLDWPDDTGLLMFDPDSSYGGATFPQADGRARVYLGYTAEQSHRLSGKRDIDAFLGPLRELLGEQDVFTHATAVGPLATFEADMSWVEHPYEDGLALIGDAAGFTDPTYGQGLSIGFRDARVLGEALVDGDDPRAAAEAYASQHDRYFHSVVSAESWLDEFLLTPGEEGNAIRARIFTAWAQDPSRNIGATFNGPDFEATDEVRDRFLALDTV